MTFTKPEVYNVLQRRKRRRVQYNRQHARKIWKRLIKIGLLPDTGGGGNRPIAAAAIDNRMALCYSSCGHMALSFLESCHHSRGKV